MLKKFLRLDDYEVVIKLLSKDKCDHMDVNGISHIIKQSKENKYPQPN